MEGLERIVLAHRLFAGLDAELGQVIAGCARNMRFQPGEYLFRHGEPATELYLIRHGQVALEIATPGGAGVVFATEGEGEIVGMSWLIPPYRWRFDARAVEPVRAIGIDAECLRRKCEADHHLGYELMKRIVPQIVHRLDEARLQLLDVYGKRGA
jgi:CRP-like cAMP-binding protein